MSDRHRDRGHLSPSEMRWIGLDGTLWGNLSIVTRQEYGLGEINVHPGDVWGRDDQ